MTEVSRNKRRRRNPPSPTTAATVDATTAGSNHNDDDNNNAGDDNRVPVTLLFGFPWAGKTTLLKHILEATHAEDSKFKCAVIVKDMAELDIDEASIDPSGQSDDEDDNDETVVAMKNGSVCCTLKKADLVERVIGLLGNNGEGGNNFDCMIIEEAVVDEPDKIARLFTERREEEEDDDDEETPDNDDDDDDDNNNDGVVLADVARLDTCVAVIDSSSFLKNMDAVETTKGGGGGASNQELPQLLAQQIENANVILLNNTDQLSKNKLQQVNDQIAALNIRAKVLTSQNGLVDLTNIFHTGLFSRQEFSLATAVDWIESARTVDSGKSQVLLPPKTRKGKKAGVSSFVYQARRPFAMVRFNEDFVDKYFLFDNEDESDSEDENDDDDEATGGERRGKKGGEVDKEVAEELAAIKARENEEAARKKKVRTKEIGELLRFKGIMWMANSHDFQGNVCQAGNVVSIDAPGTWEVLTEKAWLGTDEEKESIRKNWVAPYGDRRQELVFIGTNLNSDKIQENLDACLLNDEEFALGVDGWKATMGDMVLDDNDPS